MEIIMAIVVISIISGLLAGILSRTGVTYEFIKKRNSIAKDNRLFQDRFFAEVKTMDSLTVSTNKDIRWKKSSGTYYEYIIDASGKITRSIDGGTAVDFIGDVSYANSNFTYYDEDALLIDPPPSNTTERNTVRLVGIEITTVRDEQSHSTRRLIYLNNFKFK